MEESFVSNASSRSKTFGHNKFQIQLQESTNNIESLEQIIIDKDRELELFKNNMKTFDIQLQENNLEITRLKQDNKKYKEHIEILTFDLNKISSDKHLDETNLTNKFNLLYNENIDLLSTISQLHKTNNETVDKYNDLKLKYQTTLDLLEKKSQESNLLTVTYNDTINELNLLQELNLKQEKEIDTIKQELFKSKNETSIIKTQLFDKDISLGELHKKLALENYKIRGKIIEQPLQNDEPENKVESDTIGEISYSEPDLSINRTVKVTQRGVKLSRR
jgi:chromosome segregation ATPase